MFFGKKGDAGVGVIFIIVVIVLFLMWVVTYSQRECNSNEDCSKDSYCGSDFSCHQYPNIVQQKVAAADYTVPAFLLGLSIVVELASLYGGELKLGTAPLGGLRAELVLPAG